MNKIRFEIKDLKDLGYEHESGKVVHIYIDDQNLLDLVHEFEEKKFGRKKGHGLNYEGTDPWWLYMRLVKRDMVYIFGCAGCMEPGCWPIEIDIEEMPNSVNWKNFRNPYHERDDRSGREFWDYSEFPILKFPKEEYKAELKKLKDYIDAEKARLGK